MYYKLLFYNIKKITYITSESMHITHSVAEVNSFDESGGADGLSLLLILYLGAEGTASDVSLKYNFLY